VKFSLYVALLFYFSYFFILKIDKIKSLHIALALRIKIYKNKTFLKWLFGYLFFVKFAFNWPDQGNAILQAHFFKSRECEAKLMNLNTKQFVFMNYYKILYQNSHSIQIATENVITPTYRTI